MSEEEIKESYEEQDDLESLLCLMPFSSSSIKDSKGSTPSTVMRIDFKLVPETFQALSHYQ